MADTFSRELMRGSTDFMILGVLGEESKYGYLIQQDIERASANRVKLPAGTLYPLLHKMEAKKLIRSKWDATTGRRRKWYEITAKGKRQLASQVSQWQEYVECISHIIAGVPPLGPNPNPKPA